MDKTLLHTTMLSAVNAYERREEVVSLLAKLPLKSKKVLAMSYHENVRLLDRYSNLPWRHRIRGLRNTRSSR